MKVTGTISKAALSLLFAIAAPGLQQQEQQSEAEGHSERSEKSARVVEGTEGTSK
jgi:hypothetical protein